MIVKVVNVVNYAEPNSAFVPVSQRVSEGIIQLDSKGYYAVALAENLPGQSVARSNADTRVFDRNDLDSGK